MSNVDVASGNFLCCNALGGHVVCGAHEHGDCEWCPVTLFAAAKNPAGVEVPPDPSPASSA